MIKLLITLPNILCNFLLFTDTVCVITGDGRNFIVCIIRHYAFSKERSIPFIYLLIYIALFLRAHWKGSIKPSTLSLMIVMNEYSAQIKELNKCNLVCTSSEETMCKLLQKIKCVNMKIFCIKCLHLHLTESWLEKLIMKLIPD